MLRMTFFSILTSWESFLARSGPKAPAVPFLKAWPVETCQKKSLSFFMILDVPKLLRPKRRPLLVEEAGGGGFSICDAVGARDWRIEYVRCILLRGSELM
jgi:hypothetical protein